MGWVLRLTKEEDNGSMVPDGLWNVESEGYQLCLVGRLLSNRNVNFEGFSRSVQSVINLVKGMEIKQLPVGQFFLRFITSLRSE
ncbi:UNVERIFIED_CONTAM: hypothetical protein Sradi_2083600 [Sesamum radiatum]|uniref:Uncharacterized protein n=1 Tax=Sesamum radiatum TaxID=300843 RepID=A0AAW2THS0_SESRA